MSIELHCEKCGKLIRAPDNAGGKHGKCPHCENSVYIPMPPDDSEEIGIVPVDADEERRDEQLRRETARLAAAVDHETGAPADNQVAGGGAGRDDYNEAAVDVAAEIESFLVAMRDSKLEQADESAARLKKVGSRARDHVEGLMLDEMPFQIEGVPAPLVKGFLKTLVDRLKE